MNTKIIRSGPWIDVSSTGACYRIVWVDECPGCHKPGATAVHHVGQPTANCNQCYIPFDCPPPPRR